MSINITASSVQEQKLKRLIEFRVAQSKVAAGAAQEVTAKAEQTFGWTSMRLWGNRMLLVLPKSGEHGPAKR